MLRSGLVPGKDTALNAFISLLTQALGVLHYSGRTAERPFLN